MANMDVSATAGMAHAGDAKVTASGMRVPLSHAESNTEYTVLKISGKDETKKHLSDLGFVEGERIFVTSSLGGNIIVTVKDVKVALGEELAKRVTVTC